MGPASASTDEISYYTQNPPHRNNAKPSRPRPKRAKKARLYRNNGEPVDYSTLHVLPMGSSVTF